jgi:thiamine transport system substrate-binding protein
LAAEYGLLPVITDQFETDNNVELEIVNFPDTGAMLNQLIAEKDQPKADVVLGLDNINFVEAIDYDLLQPYQPARANEIASAVWFDEAYTMTPFDYGYVGLVYDAQQLDMSTPVSLATLAADPAYADKIILEQPGLSSPGTQFLVWLHAAYDDVTATTIINQLADQVLTVAPDWNTAYYTMFLNSEAPIVLSYLTSPAYHIDQEDSVQFQAIPMTEGYLRQVEGVAIVTGTDASIAAQSFVDYMLSDAVQNEIPRTQWMWPVLGDASSWPAAYDQIITPTTDEVLTVSPATLRANYQTWLNEWNTAFGTL